MVRNNFFSNNILFLTMLTTPPQVQYMVSIFLILIIGSKVIHYSHLHKKMKWWISYVFDHFFSCRSMAGWLQPNLCNCEKCCYNCNPLFFNIPRLDLDPIPCHFIHSLPFLTKSAWWREKVRRGQLRRNREKWQSMRAKPPAHAPYVSKII